MRNANVTEVTAQVRSLKLFLRKNKIALIQDATSPEGTCCRAQFPVWVGARASRALQHRREYTKAAGEEQGGNVRKQTVKARAAARLKLTARRFAGNLLHSWRPRRGCVGVVRGARVRYFL
jgi:hypothetical protein